jgi:hypothetical protein
MNCSPCLTAKEILDWVRTIDQGCAKKVQRFNRILRNFYLDTIDIPYNIVAEPIVASWIHTINTQYPIYKIFGFFGTGCDKCYIDQNNKCCGEGTSQLKMYNVDFNPWIGQYKKICDTEILAWIPNNLQNGYIVYSRWPVEILSMDNQVCLDPAMRTWLEFYIEMFYSETAWELNRMNLSKANYKEWLDKIKEASDNMTFSVEMWVSVNAPFYKN